ncbi:MAG TPA: hypothetical protein VMR75_03680 [Candidatus Saccharimonadales bacterium]|nr:hypothetical protein [Candidatus Saccharimonadales bacterium]
MNRKTIAIARGVGAIAAVAALVVGITFAALNTSATLADNTLSTATANLTVSTGGAFGASEPGFTISGLVPGTGVTDPFYLSNTGGVNLGLTVQAASTGGGTITESGTTSSTDLSNVSVVITNLNTGNSNTYNLAELVSGAQALTDPINAGVTGTSSPPNAPGDYSIHFDINPATINGAGPATVTGFDLVFAGTQQ